MLVKQFLIVLSVINLLKLSMMSVSSFYLRILTLLLV